MEPREGSNISNAREIRLKSLFPGPNIRTGFSGPNHRSFQREIVCLQDRSTSELYGPSGSSLFFTLGTCWVRNMLGTGLQYTPPTPAIGINPVVLSRRYPVGGFGVFVPWQQTSQHSGYHPFAAKSTLHGIFHCTKWPLS